MKNDYFKINAELRKTDKGIEGSMTVDMDASGRFITASTAEILHKLHKTNPAETLVAIDLFKGLDNTSEWEDFQKGEWIYAKCKHCRIIQDVRSNYCPECGRLMLNKERGKNES